MTHEEFDLLMAARGWVVFEHAVPEKLIARLKVDLATKEAECRSWQVRNGIAEDTSGSAHHVLGDENSLDEFIAALYLDEFIERWFEGPYILNSFGASLNRGRSKGSYLHRMHKDVRSHTHGYRLLLNMLVMLDDFTTANGATYALSGSHRTPEKPQEDFFYRYADRLIGPAGSVALFDSNLWHAAGVNSADTARAALTLTFSRPFIKQQMDYPRFLGDAYIARMPERVRQVLGFYARTPSSYDEWYQPRETRFYRADQN